MKEENKIRNRRHYWVNPDGMIVRGWNKTEYSSLLPTDRIKIKMYESCCPGCGKHYYYTLDEKIKYEEHVYCSRCKKKTITDIIEEFNLYPNKGYREIDVEVKCLERYEYYNEEYEMWIPRLNLN